jgi:N-acetylglucosamine kinase-like BadF-type ATPase
LAEEIHRRRIPVAQLAELPPVVFAEAAGDRVAAEIVDRLAAEVVVLARVAMERLGLDAEPVEVLLGGGLLQASDGGLIEAIEAGLRDVDSEVVVRRPSAPPIVGAALLALDELGAGLDEQARLRRELGVAVERLGGPGGRSENG